MRIIEKMKEVEGSTKAIQTHSKNNRHPANSCRKYTYREARNHHDQSIDWDTQLEQGRDQQVPLLRY